MGRGPGGDQITDEIEVGRVDAPALDDEFAQTAPTLPRPRQRVRLGVESGSRSDRPRVAGPFKARWASKKRPSRRGATPEHRFATPAWANPKVRGRGIGVRPSPTTTGGRLQPSLRDGNGPGGIAIPWSRRRGTTATFGGRSATPRAVVDGRHGHTGSLTRWPNSRHPFGVRIRLLHHPGVSLRSTPGHPLATPPGCAAGRSPKGRTRSLDRTRAVMSAAYSDATGSRAGQFCR
mgnify:CR=1 FL=1